MEIKTEMMSLEDVERRHILETLASVNNDRNAAAKTLGISVKTLYVKMHRYYDQGYIKEWRMPRNESSGVGKI